MRRLLGTVFTSIIFLISPFFMPVTAFADTYGSGSYGGCAYNAGCSSSNSNIVSSTINSVNNAVSTFFCSAQAPSSSPNLYEVDVTSTAAKVYFSPAGGPYDQHYISYGQGNTSEGYGIDLSTSQSPGADYYKIQQLSSNTTYTFKVRGGNGCKPGPWSNTLTVQTLTEGSKAMKKFYPNSQAQYIQASTENWWTQATNYVSDHLPGASTTSQEAPKQYEKASPKASQGSHLQHKLTASSSSPSFWGSIGNFFSGIFHAL